MTDDEIKNAVREKYGMIASTRSTCCGPACGCDSGDTRLASMQFNERYKGDESDIVASADLGLGCGTPVEFAELAEGMTVLDLGSGGGIDVFLSARAVGPSGKSIGVDMTDEMLQRANQNRQKLGITNAEFRKGDIENLPVGSETVDRILSNCVINLAPDKVKVFSEMHRVLKPGGKFIVSDIVSVGQIPADLRNDMETWAGCVAGALDKEDYLDLVRKAGFTKIEIVSEKPHQLDLTLPFGLRSITLKGTK